MSTPSTPTRSRANSVPSLLSSQNEPASVLTPRSKVRAMMAAVDNESDDESRNTSPPRSSSQGRVSTDVRRSEASELAAASTTTSSDEEDEDDIVLPRGKLAARLQGEKETLKDQDILQRGHSKPSGTAETQKVDEPERRGASQDAFKGSHEGVEEDAEANPIVPRLGRCLLRRKPKPSNGANTEESSPSETPAQNEIDDSVQANGKNDELDSLFGSPEKIQRTDVDANGSDFDAPDPAANSRFKALVERKRAERRAKEAEEQRKREERRSKLSQMSKTSRNAPTSDLSGSEDDDGITGRKLTQQSRPSRKASKKALEEMQREQQRIQRNMQLAHEATVKKKYSKEAFLAKYTKKKPESTTPVQPASSRTCSSAPASDGESKGGNHTPASSPPTSAIDSAKGKAPAQTELPGIEVSLRATLVEEDLPTLDEIIESAPFPEDTNRDKGKGKLVEEPSPEPKPKEKVAGIARRSIKVHAPKNPIIPANYIPDSDDELDIIPQEKKSKRLDDIFAKVPAKKAADSNSSMLRLRALAHLTSPSKRAENAKLSHAQLSASLQRGARRQAAKEREEKIRELEAKGIVIQSAEERARDQAQVEDMLEKARQEAEELKKKEKEERRENGEDDESSGDEDYEEVDASDGASADGDEEEIDIELSGSEDEAESEEDEEKAEKHGLFDNEASESEDEEQEENEQDEADGQDDERSDNDDLPVVKSTRRSNQKRILDDEDDEDENEPERQPNSPTKSVDQLKPQMQTLNGTQNGSNPFTAIPESPEQSKNPFAGASSNDGASMGLTQAFAATMSDGLIEGSQDEPDSMEQLGNMPQPDLPLHDIYTQSASQAQVTQASQTNDSFQVELNFAQTQVQDSFIEDDSPGIATQLSEMPDPTQDVGIGAISPVKPAPRAPTSTVETVIIPPVQVQESPVAKRKGRLQRRKEARAKKIAAFSDEEADSEMSGEEVESDFEVTANAFDVLKKNSVKARPAEPYDKKNSKARDMFDEQAEESEDEYAGLGGADGEDSDEEPDATLQQMIDEGHVDVDEAKLAALYADKDRAADEAAVQKLFKDIQNGGLRRKRGAEFDLDDSDDDIQRRRARKRAEFAKMRRALVEGDANVGKIAEDPKKKAFLRAIEDREIDADLDNDWLNEDDATPGDESTQEVPESQIPDSQSENYDPNSAMPAPANPLKRKRPAGDSATASRRPFRPSKPASIADIRANISSLTEDPRDLSASGSIFEHDSSDSDEGSRRSANRVHPRRTGRAVVDRLAAKRADSQSSTGSGGSGQRMAFHDPASAGADVPGFKVPSLLRRATTSSLSSVVADQNGVVQRVESTERAIGGEKGDFVRKGGSKKSSVNFWAREERRKVVLKASEVKKEKGRQKIAGERRAVLGGVLGGGQWE